MHDMSSGLGTEEWSETVGADIDWEKERKKKLMGSQKKLKRTSAWEKKKD